MSVAVPAIVAKECRFATHCKSDDGGDLHVIKEILHYDDGTTKPALKFVKDFKRPFGVVKKAQRNFKDHKEWIDMDKLDYFECRERDLFDSVAKAIGTPWKRGTVRDLCESPYIFGVDIPSTSHIKRAYKDKYPNTNTAYRVAVFDTETDVVKGTKEILMATISCKTTVYTVVQKSFVNGYADPVNRIHKLVEKYLGDIVKARGITVTVLLVDTEIEVLKKTMAKAHELAPDILTAWNMLFDLGKIQEACARANIEVKDLLCDPSVPEAYRHFKLKEGPAKKVTASGRVMNFKPSQRWHSVSAPASFVWLDAMCTYRQVRTGSAELRSYSLDFILQLELKRGKLAFKEAEDYSDLAWHVFMQTNYPLEYVVYNMFDCIGIEMLDEKTLDLQVSLPMFAGFTDFAVFNSQPKKSFNEVHWLCRDNKKMSGSSSSEMQDDFDEVTVDVKGWITMLQPHQVVDNGLCLIKENPEIRTAIRIGVADFK